MIGGDSSAPRVAIVGSTSPVGKELRQLMESGACRWPLTVLDTDEYAGLLQEFGGEIGIVQVISPSRLEEVDVAVFTCAPVFFEQYLETGAYLPPLTVDLTGGDRAGAVYLDGWSAPPPTGGREPSIAPRSSTLVLARLLNRLDEAFCVEAAEAVLLEPASQCGHQALEALEQETVRTLTFHQGEDRSRLRAFNVLGPGGDSERRGNRISVQVGSLTLARCPAPAVRIVGVPVFQGEAISLHVRLEETPETSELATLLARDGLAEVTDTPPSPLEVLGSDRIHVSGIAEGATENSFWIWAVSDNLRLAAGNALGLIRAATFTDR